MASGVWAEISISGSAWPATGHDGAVIEQQTVAVAQRHGLFEIEQEFGALLAGEHDAPAGAVAGVEHDAVGGGACVPVGRPLDLRYPQHATRLVHILAFTAAPSLWHEGRAKGTSPIRHGAFMQPFRLAVISALLMLALAPARAAEPTGLWLTQKGDARIHVTRCGNAMCGTVVWIKDAIDARTGRPPLDERNPDPAKRNRRIVGMRIFAMAPDGRGNWAGGIYNSDDGQTYAGQLALREGDELEVRGCAGALCGAEFWHKLEP